MMMLMPLAIDGSLPCHAAILEAPATRAILRELMLIISATPRVRLSPRERGAARE